MFYSCTLSAHTLYSSTTSICSVLRKQKQKQMQLIQTLPLPPPVFCLCLWLCVLYSFCLIQELGQEAVSGVDLLCRTSAEFLRELAETDIGGGGGKVLASFVRGVYRTSAGRCVCILYCCRAICKERASVFSGGELAVRCDTTTVLGNTCIKATQPNRGWRLAANADVVSLRLEVPFPLDWLVTLLRTCCASFSMCYVSGYIHARIIPPPPSVCSVHLQ